MSNLEQRHWECHPLVEESVVLFHLLFSDLTIVSHFSHRHSSDSQDYLLGILLFDCRKHKTGRCFNRWRICTIWNFQEEKMLRLIVIKTWKDLCLIIQTCNFTKINRLISNHCLSISSKIQISKKCWRKVHSAITTDLFECRNIAYTRNTF